MKTNMINVNDGLQKSHDTLFDKLQELVSCIRNFELGDFSPLMDEIFDAEHALKEALKYYKQ